MPYAAPIHRPAGYRTPEQRKREADQNRGTTAERGYDYAWQKLSKAFLAQNPLCQCDDCIREERVVAANVVDHIIPIEERPDLRLAWSNLRSMAKTHHDRHTARTKGFAQRRTP